METSLFDYRRGEALLLRKLQTLPLLGYYARTRGWQYVLAWAHRISGLLLVLYVWFHIATLAELKTPEVFNAKMNFLQQPFFVLLEWMLAVPVIFHALNGARVILYEVFYSQADTAATRATLGFSLLYVLLLGWLMIMGDQVVSPFLFWLPLFAASSGLAWWVAGRIWSGGNPAVWKLQRISGTFLLVMTPAHLLFMHLQPAVGHDATVIVTRMQPIFMRLLDLALLVAVLYHGGYGLASVINEYLPQRILKYLCAALVVLIMGFFLMAGFDFTLFI